MEKWGLTHHKLPKEVLARFELKGTGYVDIKSKDDYEIAKAYWKALAKKLEIPDGAECVFNRASGAYDLPVKKWRKRAKKEAKA
jgi:hypothetical protein